MKSKLLLACTILFFCSSFLCGQNQTSKVANSAETNNGAVRHPWQGKRVGYLGDSITSNPQLSSSASFLRLNVLSSLN